MFQRPVICLVLISSGVAAAGDQPPEPGFPALISAVRREQAMEVARLLKAGADPDTASESGMTALQHAAISGNLEVMQILIDAGADLDARDPLGCSALVEAVCHRGTAQARLLLKAGAKPHAAALAKAWLERRGTVKLLLDSGVKPDDGLVSAAQGGHLEIMKLLLEAGADVNVHSPANNQRGSTPLHLAISGDCDLKTVRKLLEAGADPRLKNKEGESPLSLATTPLVLERMPAYRLMVNWKDEMEPEAPDTPGSGTGERSQSPGPPK
jgi:ankyrin repeat protein